jgi:hypothetical protein
MSADYLLFDLAQQRFNIPNANLVGLHPGRALRTIIGREGCAAKQQHAGTNRCQPPWQAVPNEVAP